MTLGENIQQLRKKNGLSQEALAEQLAVSRQAVSKWESDASAPDLANLLRLSRLFGVSTDLLLRGGSEGAQDPPRQKERANAPFQTAVGILAVGLLLSFAAWDQWRTFFAAAPGLALQILGLVFFERLSGGAGRKKLYTAAAWLMLPFPVRFLTGALLMFYPRPMAYWMPVALSAVAYLLLCGAATWRLRRRDGFT